jgi:hypothetical protein
LLALPFYSTRPEVFAVKSQKRFDIELSHSQHHTFHPMYEDLANTDETG